MRGWGRSPPPPAGVGRGGGGAAATRREYFLPAAGPQSHRAQGWNIPISGSPRFNDMKLYMFNVFACISLNTHEF